MNRLIERFNYSLWSKKVMTKFKGCQNSLCVYDLRKSLCSELFQKQIFLEIAKHKRQ